MSAGLLHKIEIVGSTGVTVKSSSGGAWGIVDTMGCEGVLFLTIGSSGHVVGGATTLTNIIRVLGSSANSTTAMKHLRAAGSVVASSGGVLSTTENGALNSFDQSIAAVDVVKPTKRYVMIKDMSSDRAVVAIKYGLHRMGSTEARDSSTLEGTTQVIGACTS